MAQDIFLKISGINGESNDSLHKGEIEISTFEWSVSQPANLHSGSGGGSGKATVGDLKLEHEIDRASPNLLKYCLTGKHIPEAVLVVRKAGGNPLEYFKLTISDVMVVGVYMLAASGSSGVLEHFSLAFSKVSQEYVLQNAQGGSAGMVRSAFDIRANREV
jgi:type VI secretion system secreted protein Hcp